MAHGHKQQRGAINRLPVDPVPYRGMDTEGGTWLRTILRSPKSGIAQPDSVGKSTQTSVSRAVIERCT